MDISAILIPFIVVLVPALITYSQVPTQVGLVCGATIGIVIGIHANILPLWIIVIIVIALVSSLFMERQRGED